MELFPAADAKTPGRDIQRFIEQCDYYIVIIGGRYGIKGAGRKELYGDAEYDYAVEAGLPAFGIFA